MEEVVAFGISLWKQTHPAPLTPPAPRDQEAEIEKDLWEGEEVEEAVVVVAEVVVAAVEEEEEEEELGLPSQPIAIYQLSWATW